MKEDLTLCSPHNLYSAGQTGVRHSECDHSQYLSMSDQGRWPYVSPAKMDQDTLRMMLLLSDLGIQYPLALNTLHVLDIAFHKYMLNHLNGILVFRSISILIILMDMIYIYDIYIIYIYIIRIHTYG